MSSTCALILSLDCIREYLMVSELTSSFNSLMRSMSSLMRIKMSSGRYTSSMYSETCGLKVQSRVIRSGFSAAARGPKEAYFSRDP